MTKILDAIRAVAATPPDRRLFAFATVALAAAAAFYLLSIIAVAGSTSIVPSLPWIVSVAGASALTACFCARHPSAVGLTFGVLMLTLLIGMSFATEVGYGMHFLGRSFPLADPLLARADRAMGFDSLALLHWADGHPRLAAWLQWTYVHCATQAMIAIPILLAMRQNQRLLTFAGANFTCLLVVHLFAIAMPAVGAYTFHHFSAADHPHITLAASDTAQAVYALRGADYLSLPAGRLMGLVTFPSYHMVTACLFGWLFWRTPLRVPALIFNASVAIASLIDGCHYLTDIIAGAALSIASIAMVRRVAGAVERLQPVLRQAPALSGFRKSPG